MLRVTLTGLPPTLAISDKINITLTVTYLGLDPSSPAAAPADEPAARPITFYTWPFSRSDFLFLYRKRDAAAPWEEVECDEDLCMGFRLVEDVAPIHTTAGAHEAFVSLQVGESWSVTHEVDCTDWSGALELDGTRQPGQVFHFSFPERVMEWWGWGTKEDHMDSEIVIPGWNYGPTLNANGNVRKREERDYPEVLTEKADSADFVFTDRNTG